MNATVVTHWRVARGLVLLSGPLLLWTVTAFTVAASPHLDDANLGVVWALVIPLLFLNSVVKLIAIEENRAQWEVLSSYPIELRRLFWSRYVSAICLSASAVVIPAIGVALLAGPADLWRWAWEPASVGLLVSSVGAVAASADSNYEAGIVAGIVALAISIRIGIPSWLLAYVAPPVSLLVIALAAAVYSSRKGVAA